MADSDTHVHRLVLEMRVNAVALICEHCSRPFITAENGEATILNKHGKEQHSNVLTTRTWRLFGLILETQERTGKNPVIM